MSFAAGSATRAEREQVRPWMDDHVALTIGLEELDPGSVKLLSTLVVEGIYDAFRRSVRRREELPGGLSRLDRERGDVLLEAQVDAPPRRDST